jgi:drug/metabolite transporter (DMT)-like permease
MCCFAANSLLCRQALRTGSIDPASFTLVRIGSGALMLSLLLAWSGSGPGARPAGRGVSALALFWYAVCFSFAYVTLPAGVGAIVLFAAVQVTMIAWGIARGERPRALHWAGLALAFGGLVWLTLPGAAAAPSLAGVLLMAGSGAAWGAYSSLDRRGAAPLPATAGNFRLALVPAGAVALLAGVWRGLDAAPSGLALAATSGALASGVGYSLWYAALPGLSAARAAVVQLSVPVLAAFGGVLLLGETLRPRTVAAAAAILAGVALAVLTRARR